MDARARHQERAGHGLEQIIEAFYSLAICSPTNVSGSYQFVVNPGAPPAAVKTASSLTSATALKAAMIAYPCHLAQGRSWIGTTGPDQGGGARAKERGLFS